MSETIELKTHIVPCDGCTACCENDLIFLHPECGDKIEEYKYFIINDRPALKRKSNGECTYLIKGEGCSIWNKRPAVCKELDCKVFLDINPYQLVAYLKRGMLNKEIIKAAKRRVKR